MKHFDIEIFLPDNSPHIAILRLSGSLDAFSIGDLEKKIGELLEGQRKDLVINLKNLKFLSSPAMGLFLGTLGELEKRNGTLRLVEITNPEVHDAMNLLGLFEVFPVHASESEALSKLI